MLVDGTIRNDPHLSVSLSPLLPSSMEEDDHPHNTKKRVHFGAAFQPTHTVFTPRLNESQLKYRAPDDRLVGSTILAPPTDVSSIAQPNYDDSLRRVSVVLYQHIRRCEKRHREQQVHHNSTTMNSHIKSSLVLDSSSSSSNTTSSTTSQQTTPLLQSQSHSIDASPNIRVESDPITLGTTTNTTSTTKTATTTNTTSNNTRSSTLSMSLIDLPVDQVFREENFVTPQYKYTFVRIPRLHPLTSYVMEKKTSKSHVPSVDEIFRFCKNLFNKAQLSAECTIVCLIYIERLMEQTNVPLLLASTWKPIVLCGLLLASKVWQDLSSWNVEISNIYPQYPLHSINRLERVFLHHIQWDLYISGSVYAKYYFALRSLTEKKDFRRRYHYTMKVDPPNTKRLEARSAAIKNQLYSKSL